MKYWILQNPRREDEGIQILKARPEEAKGGLALLGHPQESKISVVEFPPSAPQITPPSFPSYP